MILDDWDSENSLKRKSAIALSAVQRRGDGDFEQYAPDATRGCTENASLNTGDNCKRNVYTALHNVM
jgi:hypothetical protein